MIQTQTLEDLAKAVKEKVVKSTKGNRKARNRLSPASAKKQVVVKLAIQEMSKAARQGVDDMVGQVVFAMDDQDDSPEAMAAMSEEDIIQKEVMGCLHNVNDGHIKSLCLQQVRAFLKRGGCTAKSSSKASHDKLCFRHGGYGRSVKLRKEVMTVGALLSYKIEDKLGKAVEACPASPSRRAVACFFKILFI